jgi:hypothetical protein
MSIGGEESFAFLVYDRNTHASGTHCFMFLFSHFMLCALSAELKKKAAMRGTGSK